MIHTQFDQLAPVVVTALPTLARQGAWKTDLLHANEFHRLLWVTRGQGVVTFDAQSRAFGAFQAIFLPAGTPYTFENRSNVFGFAVDIARDANLEMPTVPMRLHLRDSGDQRRCGQMIESLQSELANAKEHRLDMLSARAVRHQTGLMGVWLERKAIEESKDKRALSPAQKLVVRFLDLVQVRLGTGDNVAALADALGVTPTHLTRCCRKTLGRSALDLLNERVHHKARVLLQDSPAPVKDIATQVGFASAAYFTRAFQNQSGLTPSEFRNQQQAA